MIKLTGVLRSANKLAGNLNIAPLSADGDSGGGGALIVRPDPDREGYATHTAADVKAAIESGQTVCFEENTLLKYLVDYSDNVAGFERVATWEEIRNTTMISVSRTVLNKDGSYQTVTTDVLGVPSYSVKEDIGKILSCTADGLVWIDPPQGETLEDLEGVMF